MTPIQSREDFDRLMADWMHADARVAPPSGLVDATLNRTRTTRRRPKWLLSEWWLPTRFAARLPVLLRPVPLLILAGLVLVAGFLVILAGGQRRVPPPFGPAGNGLLVVDTNASLEIADPRSGGTRPLVQEVQNAAGVTFSRDGTHLAFWGDGSPDSLYVADADGSHVRKLAAGLWISTDKLPAWSPDGRFIVFSTESAAGTGDEHLVVVDVGTGRGSSITPAALDGIRALFPAWSPDGAWIALVGIPAADPQRTPSYWIVHPDGSDARVLSTSALDPNTTIAPHWAPDPSRPRLAYSALGGPSTGVFVLDLGSGRETPVSPGEPGLWPAWSPDASSLAWLTDIDTTDLRVAAVDPAASPRTVPNAGITGPPAWSPDGRELYGLDGTGTALVVVPADGSAPSVRITHARSQALPDWQRVTP